MAELRVIGEEFLKHLRQAVADELMEEADHGQMVIEQDINYEMNELAIWLTEQYFKAKNNGFSEDSD